MTDENTFEAIAATDLYKELYPFNTFEALKTYTLAVLGSDEGKPGFMQKLKDS